jgi:formate/nitrite transporter FocA (FNT family)
MDIGHFVLFATLGNIAGGVVFVAFFKYVQARSQAMAISARLP